MLLRTPNLALRTSPLIIEASGSIVLTNDIIFVPGSWAVLSTNELTLDERSNDGSNLQGHTYYTRCKSEVYDTEAAPFALKVSMPKGRKG